MSRGAERAHELRELILEIALAAGSSHIGSSLSIADVLAALYFDVVRDGPDGRPHDRVILSKGHAASALYAALALRGVLDRDEVLAGYCQDGGRFAGHPERGIPGVEATGGSLGHGLAVAVGGALADRMDRSDRVTFCVLGDGELQEGSVWEAAALAAQLRLGSLAAVVDANGLQGLGRTEDVVALEPLADRWRSFGWRVHEVDGHDCAALAAACHDRGERPTAVIARTVKGKGVGFMEDELIWHYRSLRPADRERVLTALAEGREAVA